MNSVVIKSIDRKEIELAVNAYIGNLRAEHPEIDRIIWFGSWVNGLRSPGSDVDMCLILRSSDKVIRDRIPDYLPIGFPVGIDLFVYTTVEFEQVRNESPGWYQVIKTGREL